jgi:hypothetical protein
VAILKTSYLHFLLQIISPITSLSVVLKFIITLYTCPSQFKDPFMSQYLYCRNRKQIAALPTGCMSQLFISTSWWCNQCTRCGENSVARDSHADTTVSTVLEEMPLPKCRLVSLASRTSGGIYVICLPHRRSECFCSRLQTFQLKLLSIRWGMHRGN